MRGFGVQVSFAVQSQMMQHLAGPTHKKTVERAAAEERRLEQLGNNRWAAENAAVQSQSSTVSFLTIAPDQPSLHVLTTFIEIILVQHPVTDTPHVLQVIMPAQAPFDRTDTCSAYPCRHQLDGNKTHGIRQLQGSLQWQPQGRKLTRTFQDGL